MGVKAFEKKNLEQIEFLRYDLYKQVNNRREMLCSKEVYEISKRLDQLIIKHMSSQSKKDTKQ